MELFLVLGTVTHMQIEKRATNRSGYITTYICKTANVITHFHGRVVIKVEYCHCPLHLNFCRWR